LALRAKTKEKGNLTPELRGIAELILVAIARNRATKPVSAANDYMTKNKIQPQHPTHLHVDETTLMFSSNAVFVYFGDHETAEHTNQHGRDYENYHEDDGIMKVRIQATDTATSTLTAQSLTANLGNYRWRPPSLPSALMSRATTITWWQACSSPLLPRRDPPLEVAPLLRWAITPTPRWTSPITGER
jgi:hypothetical protein